MIIRKGTLLEVNHSRSGKWIGRAMRKFDTKEEWYPIELAQKTPVEGMSNTWYEGDEMPCRKSLCTVKILNS